MKVDCLKNYGVCYKLTDFYDRITRISDSYNGFTNWFLRNSKIRFLTSEIHDDINYCTCILLNNKVYDFDLELLRRRQGKLTEVDPNKYDTNLNFSHERPTNLYAEQLDCCNMLEPWADNLGYAIAHQLSSLTGIPLVEPLPGGLKGLVIITGDDDQADLENYDKQLAILDGMPVTYFMHYLTRHTKETLAKLPTCVEIGVHPDALETPESYDRLCAEQTEFVRTISGADVRVVRNHGYLSDGYWGHLKTWEKCGLEFDMNLPGVDGTALNGSFMPFKVRRPDGTWSDHYSLLTAFGDGMVFALGMSDKQAARRIRMVARQIERRNPGVLVFNLHPQNVEKTRLMHEEVVRLAGRKGWGAMTAGSYLRWLRKFETLSIEMCADGCTLCTTSEEPMEGVVLKIPTGKASWKRKELGTWHGSVKVSF